MELELICNLLVTFLLFGSGVYLINEAKYPVIDYDTKLFALHEYETVDNIKDLKDTQKAFLYEYSGKALIGLGIITVALQFKF